MLSILMGGAAMVTLAAVACALFLYFALRTDIAKDSLRKKIEARLTRTVGSPVAVGDVGDPGLSSVELADVVIENRRGTPAITAERVAITYDPVALLGGELEAGSIRIAGLEVDAAALTEAPPAVQSVSSQAGINPDEVEQAELPVIHIEGGQVILEDGRRITGIAGTIGIDAQDSGLRIAIDHLSGRFRGARATMTGHLARQKSWRGRLQIDLATPVPGSSAPLEAAIDARVVEDEIRAAATFESDHARGRAQLALPVAWPLIITRAKASVDIDDLGALTGHRALGAGSLSLTAHGPLSRLEVAGTARAEAGGARTQVKFRGTLPDLGAKISLTSPDGLSGTAQAKLSLRENRTRATLTAITAQTPVGPIRNGEATFVSDGQQLSLSGRAEAAGGTLAMRLVRPGAGAPIAVTADLQEASLAALDSILAPQSPRGLRARGPVSGHLSWVVGRPQSLRGRIEVKSARAISPFENQAIHALDLTATVAGKDITVTTTFDMAPGTAGQVRAELRGRLSGLSVSQFSGQAQFRGARLHARDRVVALTGKARIEGRRTGGTWRTDVALENARVWLPYALDRKDLHETGELADVTFVDSLEGPRVASLGKRLPAIEPRRSRVASRKRKRKKPKAWIHLTAPGGVRVFGEDLDVHIVPDLRVGIGGSEVFDGRIDVERGEVAVLGRRYRLGGGNIQFSGLATAAKLDLRLRHRFKTASLTLDVDGTIAKPRLSVSSQPAVYNQRELFAFVAGGTPDTGPLHGTSLHPRIKHEGKLATAVIANQIGQVVRRFLPIDVFSFTRAEPRRGDGLLTVGTWLEDDLFVAYRRRIDPEGGENANEMAFEYRASEDIVVEGAAGDRGRASIDLLWVKRD